MLVLAPYTIAISIVPDLNTKTFCVWEGAYGTLKATVKNAQTGAVIEDPQVQWTASWGTFDSPTSTTTIFRAPSSSSGGGSGTISVTYKGYRKEFQFFRRTTMSGSNVISWYKGNNDWRTEIAYTPALEVGVATTFTVNLYAYSEDTGKYTQLDETVDYSQAQWTFDGNGWNVSGTTGRSVTATPANLNVNYFKVVLPSLGCEWTVTINS